MSLGGKDILSCIIQNMVGNDQTMRCKGTAAVNLTWVSGKFSACSWKVFSLRLPHCLFNLVHFHILAESKHPSVCPSVLPSVTPFSQCSCHRIIMKCPGVITSDRCPCKRSRSEVKGQCHRGQTQFSRFRTVTPVEFTYDDEMMHKAWCRFFREVPYFFQGLPSHFNLTRQKNVNFEPNLSFPDCNSSLYFPMASKWCTKLEAT